MLSSFGRNRISEGAGAASTTAAWRTASALESPLGGLDDAGPGAGRFGFLFPGTSPAPADGDLSARLDALAEALTEAECDPADDGGGPPVVYATMSRFLDHDLAAPGDFAADGADRGRGEATGARLVNRRSGALRLESLYAADPAAGALGPKLARLAREPEAAARMRIDLPEPSPFGAPPLPRDGGADLPRLGRLLGEDPARCVTEADIAALPEPIRARFLRGGLPDPRLPVIGDRRNGASLLMAQFHLALLRLHNAVCEWCVDEGACAPEALFRTARRLTRWHVQWLVLEDFLPRLCDPRVLARVRAAGAPVYARMRAASGDCAGLPAPLEFWAAGHRFRHATLRTQVDLNRFHGRAAEGGPRPLTDRASLELLTHGSTEGMRSDRMPAHMVAEWDRLALPPSGRPDRALRRIDTYLTPSGGDADPETFRRLAQRTLQLGRRLSLPSAQACAAGFNAVYGDLVRPLGEAELTAGHTGEAVRDGLVAQTPLWFYVLKEAEIQTGGRRLGQLGSALVAETLVGVIANDPDSVWGRSGRAGRVWGPDDGARPGGVAIDGLPAMFRAAGLL